MISIAHSPDADDIFMYYALAFGWVDSPLKFSNVALDIQTLNEATIRGEFDVSAISFALYPLVANDYALLCTGVSFGEGYGPKLIKRKNTRLRRDFKVALSGKHTTNAMLFNLEYKHARIIYKNFLDIESAVLLGEVDAGVLIHESILDFSSELVVEREIWDIWREKAKDELPLPLGGMAIRRSIPLNRALEIESSLQKGVEIATKNKALLSKMLLSRNLIRVDSAQLEAYLNLYANEHSICLSELQKRAIDKLFMLGFEGGFYPKPISCEQYMLPREYENLRFS